MGNNHKRVEGSIMESGKSLGAEQTPSASAGYRDPKEQHFETGHLVGGIRKRAVSGGLITAGAQAIRFGLNLGFVMVLARALVPEDFGLVAMASTVISFLGVFREAGLSVATIQREHINHTQVSNLFWINLGIGGAMTAIVAASAPAIAWYFQDRRLVELTLAISVTFVISGSTIQHRAILNRQMRFRAVAAIEIVSTGAGYGTGLVLAFLGWGYWSLACASIATELSGLLLTWYVSRWRPQLPRRDHGTWSLVSFGMNWTAGSFLFETARRCDNLLIGRWYGAAAVGLYSRANILLRRPLEQFLGPMNAVFVPALSRLQSEPERYRRSFLQVIQSVTVTTFVFTAILIPLSRPVTLVVLGAKWEDTAVILANFALVAVYYPLADVCTWLFASQGRGKQWLLMTVIVSVVTVGSFVVGLPYGTAGVASAYSASCLLILLPVVFYMAGRQGPVSTSDIWRAVGKHIPVWVVVYAMAYLARGTVERCNPITQLLVSVPAGLLAGCVFIALYAPSRRVVIEMRSALGEVWSRVTAARGK